MKIVKTHQEKFSDSTFIGKRYKDADRINGSFGHLWSLWFKSGWFKILEDQLESIRPNLEPDAVTDGSYLGWMHACPNFEYWIGMLFPAGTKAPDGFEAVDIPSAAYAISWLYGREDTGELFGMDAHNRSVEAAAALGLKVCESDAVAFERYQCPRYTTPDENGNVILDYGIKLADTSLRI